MALFEAPELVLIRLLALLPALVLHEFAHGYSAWLMGDPTPKLQNRLNLNPLNHLDPVGTMMILFAPIGWAKPVQVNPYNFKDPERDFMISTLCGPLSNVVQAVFWGLLLRLTLAVQPRLAFEISKAFVAFLAMAVAINLILAIFNMIPLGPLDGHRILAYWLPPRQKQAYNRFNKQYGMAVLFGLIMIGFLVPQFNLLYVIIIEPAEFIGELISGVEPLRMVYDILFPRG